MTLQTLAVLRVLLENSTAGHYGLEVVRGSGLPSGSIYPILARLEQAGWVRSEWEAVEPIGRRRRRYYQLTEHGASRAQGAILTAQRSIRLDPGRILDLPGSSGVIA